MNKAQQLLARCEKKDPSWMHMNDRTCAKCGKDYDYLEHAEGDYTEIDGTIHTRCPHCGTKARISQ